MKAGSCKESSSVSLNRLRTLSGTHPLSYSVGTGSFPTGKATEASHLSAAGVKKEWSCTSACTGKTLTLFYSCVYVTQSMMFVRKAVRVTVELVASPKHELAQNNILDSSRRYKSSDFSSMLYRISS
jgi:hypothetical protein